MNKIALVVAAVVAMSPLTLAVAKDVQTVKQQAKPTQGNQPEQSVQKTFASLINAIEKNNYTQFISEGDAAFKQGITKEKFTQVHRQLAPRFVKGYSAIFLTKLNQQGYQVYLWKLTFKDGSDDILARLVLKDGKIGGFWFN